VNDDLFARLNRSFEKQNFMKLLGVKLESAKPGEVILTCVNREELSQQLGAMHGGAIAAVGEAACAYAAMTAADESTEMIAAEFKIDFFRRVTGKEIEAVGSVIHAGRRLITSEAKIYDKESGEQAAQLIGTIVPVK